MDAPNEVPSSPGERPPADRTRRRLEQEGWTLIGASGPAGRQARPAPADSAETSAKRGPAPAEIQAAEAAARARRNANSSDPVAIELGVPRANPTSAAERPAQGDDDSTEIRRAEELARARRREAKERSSKVELPPPTPPPPPGAGTSSAGARRARRSAVWTFALVFAGLAAVGGIAYAHFFGDVRAGERDEAAAASDPMNPDVEGLRRQVESLSVELAAAREQGQLAGERAREFEQRARRAQSLAERFPDVQRDAARAESERAVLAAELQERERDERALTSQRDELRRSIGLLEARMRDMSAGGLEQVAGLEEQLAGTRDALAARETELERERASVSRLGAELEAAEAEQQRTRSEADTQRAELERRLAELEAGSQALRGEREDLARDVERLEADLAAARAEGSDLELRARRVALLEDELRGARSELDVLSRELGTERDRIRTLEAGLAEAETQGAALNERVLELETERDQLAAERAAMAARIAELERSEAELTRESARLALDVGSLQAELDVARASGGEAALELARVAALEVALEAALDELEGVHLALERERGELALLAPQLAELERERLARQEAERELEAERGAKAALADSLAEREEERLRLAAELEAERTQRSSLEAALATERGNKDELDGELERARETSAALAAELERLGSRPAPSPPWSRALDRIATLLEGERAAEAERAFRALVEAGTLSGSSADGSTYLGALCAAGASLEAAASARASRTAPAAAELFSARDRLAEAERLRPGFASAAAATGEDLHPDEESLARFDRIQADLRAGLDLALSDLEALHGSDWDWILQAGLHQEPTLAFEHARDFGCDHLDEVARDYAAALEAECGGEQGLRVEALAGFPHLPAWGRRTEALAADLRGDALQAILDFDLARRWYADGVGASELLTGASFEDLAEPADWRAVMLVQAALAREGEGWPPPAGRAYVYAISGESRARWRVDWVDAVVAPGSVELLRAHFDAQGKALGEPTRVTIERDGMRFRYEGSEDDLLDLRATGEGVRVATLPGLSDATPPPQTGVSSADLEEFRAALAAGPALCLVERRGRFTRWFAPGLGLVREELDGSPGTLRIDLVCRVDAP